jgi:hypothetical protein
LRVRVEQEHSGVRIVAVTRAKNAPPPSDEHSAGEPPRPSAMVADAEAGHPIHAWSSAAIARLCCKDVGRLMSGAYGGMYVARASAAGAARLQSVRTSMQGDSDEPVRHRHVAVDDGRCGSRR